MSRPQSVTWVNGELSSPSSEVLRADDRGLLYGDGLFETMRAYDGRVFCLAEHMARLLEGVAVLGLPLQYDRAQLAAGVVETLTAAGLDDAYIRLTVTRGIGGRPSELEASDACTVIVTTREYHGYPARVYEEGMKLSLAAARRNDTSPLSHIKSLNYLDNILAQHHARQSGYDEAIFLNTQDIVAEGATTNIFIAEAGQIINPPLDAGVLPGIVRQCLMDGLDIVEEPFDLDRLTAADEVFLTNSLLEVAPATGLGDRRIGEGIPGPLYRRSHDFYRGLIEAGR